MVASIRHYLLIGLVIGCLLPTTLLARVSASVDRTTLYPGDVVTLTIEVENQDGEPDLSPLNKAFRTRGTSQSRQITIRNGRRADKTIWQIEIEPLVENDVVIPSISVGSEQTQPILLAIKQPTAREQAKTAADIFVEVEVENSDKPSFVQQQIRFSVRLCYRLPLLDGELSDPAVENAIIEQLGDGKRYHIRHNGSEYQVFERHYAIFPEKSGELAIPPIRFQGRVSSSRQQQRPRSARDLFFQDDFFNQQPLGQNSRPVRIQSRAVTLQIQPQPDQYEGQHWLPSEQLSLKDSWTESPPEFRAGQPVRRTITVEAKGLAASHIPQLGLDASKHLRIYPEPAETRSVTDGSWVYGQSEQHFSYIPSRPGRQTLPDIEMTWWNITTGKQQTTRLPAWQIDVLPPLESGAQQSTAEVEVDPTEGEKITETVTRSTESEINWLYVSMAALVAIVLSLGLYLRQQSTLELPNRKDKNRHATILSALQQACDNNDPAAAKQNLLQLASETWPHQPPVGLSQLAKRLEAGEAQLQTLDRVLYAAKSLDWHGAPLWQIFQHGLPIKKPPSPVRDDGLELLYPH